MSFFQNSVTAKYLKNQNKEIITEKWNAFKNHFQNSSIQENIRNSKEEQYQGGFIIDLFVNVLGYTKNPTPNFNITTEYKNVKDSKKADGAIIINDIVKAVIELNKAIKLTNKANLKLADFEGINAIYIPPISEKSEFEWFGLFEENKQKALELKSKIDTTDKEIDSMVYELYGLTEEEIEIVENS